MGEAQQRPSSRYRYYVLGLLALVYTVSFVDRQLLAILQEAIKLELGLSDAQLGILTGFSFAVFYVGAGIPIARWADRANRRNIIAVAVALWSFMTAISGYAQNYAQLVLARIGVGVGEAGCSPPAHSMISDLFPERQRATAMSIYSMGAFLGIMLGFWLGGVLEQEFGWRLAFVIVGLPGILVALVVWATVREPVRVDSLAEASEQLSAREAMLYLWRAKSLRYLMLGGGLGAVVSLGGNSWVASFFIRVHGVAAGDLGLWLAMGAGAAGAAGSLMAGFLADWLNRFDPRWTLWLAAASKALIVPVSLTVYFSPDATFALSIFAVQGLLVAMYLGPTLAALHTVVGSKGRALASAIYLFSINIIGLGLGPVLIGVISDLLVAAGTEDSLRYALVCSVPVFAALSTAAFILASRHYRADLAASRRPP